MSSRALRPGLAGFAAALLVLAAACSDGTSPDTPAKPKYTQVAAGFEFTCALTTGHEVYCWGRLFGLVDDSIPTLVATPAPLVSLAASSSVFGNQFCGLDASGLAYCWGSVNVVDHLDAYPAAPFQLPDSLRFLSLTTGQGHACGITVDLAAVCWGGYVSGKRGHGGPYPVAPGGSRPGNEIWIDLNPGPVVGGFEFVQLAAGGWHTCGVLGAGYGGQIACWGDSLGVGNPGAPFAHADSMCGPYFACVSQPVFGPALTGATLIAAGDYHSCALASQGVRCWGKNDGLQLGAPGGGAGATVSVPLPTGVVTSLSAGRGHTCALLQGGSVWCWGDGKGPAAVPFDGKLPQVSAGGHHTCAISDRGRLYCWGSNLAGELGTGSTQSSPVPVEVLSPRS